MPKILAIDDKKDNLITVSALLKSLIPDCNVITAQSGPEGIEKAKAEMPDTILLDIKMPGMDGYDVCNRLKDDESTRHIPVIMISAIKTESQDLVKGLETGADAYLAKPIDEYVLAAQVNTALRIKKAEDLLRSQKDLLESIVQKRTVELVQSNAQLKREINNRKQAEEKKNKFEAQLHHAQKMESIGTLAGGIAHDFNNILTMILGNVSMAKLRVSPEDEIFDLLSEAETASVRAQTLTKQLLTFAKGGAPLKETASIKDILKESSHFVLRGSKSGCEFSIVEDLWPAEVDCGQISQVINNIVINANQAMPEGGIIQVSAEDLIIDDGNELLIKPGRYIRISIKDQGVGIAEKHLVKIFDPYFTTKYAGSGIGLATSYSIIKKHDGHITVESRLGIGTTFHIYLPASEKTVPEKDEFNLIKGQGRILVMDDEASLRKMTGRMLENLGYKPEFAKDGAEAIESYKKAMESEKPYDAVILDLTIPGGMGGKDAVKKLLEISPEVKAIVSSGYSDDPVLSNFQEYGFKGVIPALSR